MTEIRNIALGIFLLLSTACVASDDATPSTDEPAASNAEAVYAPTTDSLEQRDLPVDQQDLAILTRAAELLEDPAHWNRDDDRLCEDDEAAGKRSLFCALQNATVAVLGTYDHRRVALQEVRFAVEDATKGMEFEHRLMEFNNLPETTLDDINTVLTVATGRVRARLETTTTRP
jgi:hypothetical protein